MRGTRIVLVRHGESRAQVDGIVGGHDGCTGLSDLGRRQVSALRDRWEKDHELIGRVHLYSSVMRRAVETAEILAPVLDVDAKAIEQDCDLCEQHPGEADGLSQAEAAKRYPPKTDDDSGSDGRRVPGGETWVEMADRVARGIDRLVERHPGEKIVVATHGGVIVHSFICWFGLDPEGSDRAWIGPMNASITEWVYGPKPFGGPWGWELVRYNDHSHVSANGLVPPW